MISSSCLISSVTADDLTEAYKRLKRLIMEYLGMSPPSTVQSDLFSGTMTSVDSSQSEEDLGPRDKSGTSQTTSVTVNLNASAWSRRSDISAVPPKVDELPQKKTEVVSRHFLFDFIIFIICFFFFFFLPSLFGF